MESRDHGGASIGRQAHRKVMKTPVKPQTLRVRSWTFCERRWRPNPSVHTIDERGTHECELQRRSRTMNNLNASSTESVPRDCFTPTTLLSGRINYDHSDGSSGRLILGDLLCSRVIHSRI